MRFGGLIVRRWSHLLVACCLLRPGSPAAPAVAAPAVVFALLADNSLLAVRADTGALVASHALTPFPASTTLQLRFVGNHLLAPSRDGRTLYALAPSDPRGADHLAVVDTASAGVRARYALPPGVAFSALAVGPVSGRLYLFGAPTHARGAFVAVVDPRTGRVLARWAVHRGDSGDWFVYQGTVAPDERALYLSYHGSDTTGIDRLVLTAGGLRPCSSANPPHVGCIWTHGGFALSGLGLLATTGEGPIEEIDGAGRVARRFDPRLPGNHLMGLALDARAGRLYVVGPCGYSGGMSVITMATARTRVLVPPPLPGQAPAFCGERFALGPRDLLVVGKTEATLPQLGIPGALLLVDARTGAVRRTVTTPAEPVDICVVSPSRA